MARSSWKNIFYDLSLIKRMRRNTNKTLDLTHYKLFCRSSNIPEDLDYELLVIHSGQHFKIIKPSPALVNVKFGQLSITRKPFYYPPKKKKR